MTAYQIENVSFLIPTGSPPILLLIQYVTAIHSDEMLTLSYNEEPFVPTVGTNEKLKK